MAIVSEQRCQRCGHVWLPRQPGRPAECPKCQSPRWDQPKEPEPATKRQGELLQLTDKRIGTVDYMEGSDIYADFRVVTETLRTAVKLAEEA